VIADVTIISKPTYEMWQYIWCLWRRFIEDQELIEEH